MTGMPKPVSADKSYQEQLTNALAFAKKNGWRIIKGQCLAIDKSAKKPRTCVCPMMAWWLYGLDEKSQARTLNRGTILPETLARNLGKRLNRHPQVIQQFMGTFDGQPFDNRPWPRNASDLDKYMARLMEDMAIELRKRFRPKAI